MIGTILSLAVGFFLGVFTTIIAIVVISDLEEKKKG